MKKWIMRLFGQIETKLGSSQHKVQKEDQAVVRQPNEDAQSSYSSDQPIRSRKEDRFNRGAFATRIANTIATRSDPSSIVIGLYAPWGDGKTSTLHFMEEVLVEHPHIVVVNFNPWHFRSEEQLLKSFFATLAEALGKSLPAMKEKIGSIFKDYGSLLSLASFSFGGVVQLNPGDAVKGVGEALSTIELDTLRTRIEKFLAESGKRVVVLIDDIDRLDRVETQAILKLVKLSASFDHTCYVLSFDDEMVAAAIGEQYGQGGSEAGRNFLEKIIQVPLHLPPPDQNSLRQMTFKDVDAALTQEGINLSQADIDAFVRHFIDGLEPRLSTPRQAKLYVNALTFALPLLKGEAHPVDVMLIEGVRIFCPKLYIAIRDNPEYFLKGRPNDHQQAEALKQQVAELISQSLNNISTREQQEMRIGLLEPLFPRLKNTIYGHEWDKKWASEQRICSDEYFKRYFTYGVPLGDVSDIEVRRLLEEFNNIDAPQQDAIFRNFAERNSIPQLIKKIRAHEEEVIPSIARTIALAIARNGLILPRERGMMLADMTYMQAAILISHLMKRVAAGQEREALADEISREVQPLPFGFEYFRWIRKSDDQDKADRLISIEAEERQSTILTERIRSHAIKTPLYLSFGRDTRMLYWLWNKQAGGAEVAEHLQYCFKENPKEVDLFLDTYVGEGWGLESGLPHRSDFNRDSYDEIAKLLNPKIIAENLRQRFGVELDTSEYYHGDNIPLARRIAHQFTFIHQKVQEEKGAV